MDAAPHPLDQLIAEAKDKLATAERQAQDARIEIAALERAKGLLRLTSTQVRRPNGKPKRARRSRALSEEWRVVLRAIGRDGEPGTDLDHILLYCSEAGLSIERHTLRSQMWNYVNRGYLARVRDGVFKLTPDGANAAGMPSTTVVADTEGEAPQA